MRRLLLVLALVAAGCGLDDSAVPTGATAPPSTTARLGPLTPTDPDRVPSSEAEAIIALAQRANNNTPPIGDHHHGGVESMVELSAADQRRLDEQLAAARAALPELDTTDEAAALGYVVAAAPGPGVGTHWVKWSLIDQPFDPAKPAMLLFHDVPGRASELVGFSYWLHDDGTPEGFAGPNDHWHRHSGLCVVNGWVDREMATSCAGVYFGGADLWMLHAWVVEQWENKWGLFATMNPRLCPSASGTPEMLRCPDDAATL